MTPVVVCVLCSALPMPRMLKSMPWPKLLTVALGRDELQLIDVGDAFIGEILAGQDRGGDRRRLQAGAAALGGDDDLVAVSVVASLAWSGAVCARAGKASATCATAQADAKSIASHPHSSPGADH